MLQIRLLGQYDIRLDGKRVLLPSRAGQSLLAFFTLTAGTPQRREKLAGMFWTDTSEETARKNLRQELWRIRKAVAAENSEGNDYLLAEDFNITFNPRSDYWLDVAQLEKSGTEIEALTSSLALYHGELMPGFYDEWILLERERIRSVFDNKMEQLLAQLIAAERWTAAQEQAERWLALGSSLEPAYRALMLVYGARGDMAKVSSVYQQCRAVLDEQLGLEPSAETRALYDGLLKGSHISSRPMAVQASGTVTFLFTDIEHSTDLLDQLGEQYAAVLAGHHRIMRTAIQKWKGQEIDNQGDAFFVTFTRSLDAVQCAAEAQRALASHPWPDDRHVRVRMGLHTGEPLIASTGYVGMDVHRAARIGDVAHGSQVLLSHTTRELVMHDLPAGLGIRDLGEHRLKDLKYPTPIYQLLIEGLAEEFPPLRTHYTGSEPPMPGVPPFKGLQYFEEADSEIFFGRELLTAKLVGRLRHTQFLWVIVGASGSGKSSLVRAGVIPALKKGQSLLDGTLPPPGSESWRSFVMTPTARPLEALAIELTRSSESVTAAATLMDDMLQDSRSLAFYLTRFYPKEHVLLVLDQFEELFTLCRDEFEREAYIDNLLAAIQQRGDFVTLILTLRADFYAHLAQYPELRDAVAQQQEYIGPMTMEELRRAIEEPARRAHWEFEPGLVDLILRDVGDEPGALPLLSHALLETWKRRAGHTLTLKGYADAGGVRGAIAHTAETLYQSLSSEEQAIARDIFLRLTELGAGTEDTRRRASFEELVSHTDQPADGRRVLNALAEARLVTLSEETAEVAHEALIQEWPTLREWLNQDRESLKLHRHLSEAAREWKLLEHDAGVLYRGARLAQAREWAGLHPGAPNTAERAFLQASVEQDQRQEQERQDQQRRELESARKLAETERARAEEQTHSANRLRTRNRLITVVGGLAIVLALLAVGLSFQSGQNARQAEANRQAAQNAQETAVANFRQAEAQRLAAEASKLLTSRGSPELIALLSLRSLNTQYTVQGDATLAAAARLQYPERIFDANHLAPILALAFSPDSRFLVTGDGNSARVWDARTGEKVDDFFAGGVNSVAYSPDGKYLLTGSFDGSARLWDTATGKMVRAFMGYQETISSVDYSRDGRRVLTGSFDGTAIVWDVATGSEVRKFVRAASEVYAVAFSPDGQYVLLATGDGTAQLWDVQTGAEVRQFLVNNDPIRPNNAVKFSPDGRFILTTGSDFIARLWDLGTGQELQNFIGHTATINSVTFSEDGQLVFTGSDDGTARKWDPKTGHELQRFTGPASVLRAPSMTIAISPNGRYLAAGSIQGEVRLWTIQPTHKLPVLQNNAVVNVVTFSPDGRTIATGDRSGNVRLWDAFTGEKLHDFTGHTAPINYGLAISPDGRHILTGSWDHTVRFWDVQTGLEVRRFQGPATTVESVAFSPDGEYAAAATSDGVWIWRTETGEELQQLLKGQPTHRVAFSPDGKYIAIGGGYTNGPEIEIWEVQTGQQFRSFRKNNIEFSDIFSVVFSPDGKYLLTGGLENNARVWDVITGKEARPFIGHTAGILTAIYSPDGRYVATASLDKTARLWDAQTRKELRRFTGHTAPVEYVAFSPNGKYLLTGSDDGTAMLWDVDYHTTMQYLCSVLLRDFTDDERTQYNIKDNTPTCPKP